MKPAERWKCLLCGRDKFTARDPHRCVGGYRKRGLKWQSLTEDRPMTPNPDTKQQPAATARTREEWKHKLNDYHAMEGPRGQLERCEAELLDALSRPAPQSTEQAKAERCYATFRTRPDENDGKEFFYVAHHHNQTKPDDGERVVSGWFISDAARLAAQPAAAKQKPVAFLNDMGTSQKLSFAPLTGAFEHFALVHATAPASPSPTAQPAAPALRDELITDAMLDAQRAEAIAEQPFKLSDDSETVDGFPIDIRFESITPGLRPNFVAMLNVAFAHGRDSMRAAPAPMDEDMEQRIAEIEKRANAATPGPWRVDDPSWKEVNDITVWCGPEDENVECLCNMGAPIAACGNLAEAEVSYTNGKFVAYARIDIPYLIQLVRSQQQQIEGMRKALERISKQGRDDGNKSGLYAFEIANAALAARDRSQQTKEEAREG